MNKEYKHGNRNKYLLRYHLILVCKYRRHLLSANNISSDMKTLAKTISNKHNVRIHYMEVDKDHLHMMIETTPNINLSDYVRTLKSYTTFGRNILPTSANAFGKRKHFGQMDIS